MKLIMHILKFIALIGGMYLIAAFVPFGHYINAAITIAGLWSLANF